MNEQAITATDVTEALRTAGIDYTVVHPGTTIESVNVTRADGRTVAFSDSVTETGETADGVDVAYYSGGIDSDVRTQDYITTPAEVTDLVAFLARP